MAASGSEQRVAVITALVANVAVALAKLGAYAITASSAMLAESLHSLADSANEVLLLVGARRSSRPADIRHPFGHARYRYLYAYVVSLTVFWIGGVLAVVEGVRHFGSDESILDPRAAFAVLAIAAALDGWSLRTTTRAGRSAKGPLTWKELVRATKAPELIVVFLEDLGALVGIGIAVIGVGLTTITGNGAWDALASIAIGILLMAIGLVVNRETQAFFSASRPPSRWFLRFARPSGRPTAWMPWSTCGRSTSDRRISSSPRGSSSIRRATPRD